MLLIFDEVMTGFRLAAGGAQERLGVCADLITYGKVIGGGMPVGAFGGRREIMQHIAPLGNVYQAGTLSGNPIAMVAGYTTLKVLKDDPSIYKNLDERTAALHSGLGDILSQTGINYAINCLGSMISVHFSSVSVKDFSTAAAADSMLFNKLFHFMLKEGVYLPPSAFETWFVSNAISYDDIEKTLNAVKKFTLTLE